MDTPIPDTSDVEQNTAPGILILADHHGVPLAFNRTARQFLNAEECHTWEDIIDYADQENFSSQLERATASQTSVSGWFRISRFDNARRQFILRAEPRFDQKGNFVGHLVSGFDVSDIPQLPPSSLSANDDTFARSDEVQQLACRWHDWIVKDATVISVSVEVLADEFRGVEISETAALAIQKLRLGATSIKREVDMLLQKCRER